MATTTKRPVVNVGDRIRVVGADSSGITVTGTVTEVSNAFGLVFFTDDYDGKGRRVMMQYVQVTAHLNPEHVEAATMYARGELGGAVEDAVTLLCEAAHRYHTAGAADKATLRAALVLAALRTNDAVMPAAKKVLKSRRVRSK